MTPKIVDKLAKREEILNAALKVFSQKGFKNTKIIDIAEAANIGKGTVYEYFRNKDEMLAAAFQAMNQEGEEIVVQILASSFSPIEKIRNIIKTLCELYSDDLEFTGIFFDFWIEGMQNEGQPAIDFKPIYAEYREMFQALLNAGVEAGEINPDISEHTASLIIGIMEGLFLQWLVDPGVFNLPEIIDGILDTLFKGIQK